MQAGGPTLFGAGLRHLSVYTPMLGVIMLCQVIAGRAVAAHIHGVLIERPHLLHIIQIQQASPRTGGPPLLQNQPPRHLWICVLIHDP